MKYIKELDSVRAIAAFWVILYHLYPDVFFFPIPGVDLFFVLSGYLVTGIILSKKDEPRFFRTYYARRCLRILPVYYLGLAFVLFVIPLASPTHQPTDAWPYYLSFTQFVPNTWGGKMPSLIYKFDHSWTLAMEAQFYLLFPYLLHRLPERHHLGTLLGLLAVSFLFRANEGPIYVLLGRMDGLVLGAVLAILGRQPPTTQINYAYKYLFVLSLASMCFLLGAVQIQGKEVVIPATCQNPEWIYLAVNLASAGFVGVVILYSGKPFLGLLRYRWLRYLGQISYGLYLYHLLAFWLVDGIVANSNILSPIGNYGTDILKVGLTLAAAILSWHLVEKPILSLKKHFRY